MNQKVYRFANNSIVLLNKNIHMHINKLVLGLLYIILFENISPSLSLHLFQTNVSK